MIEQICRIDREGQIVTFISLPSSGILLRRRGWSPGALGRSSNITEAKRFVNAKVDTDKSWALAEIPSDGSQASHQAVAELKAEGALPA